MNTRLRQWALKTRRQFFKEVESPERASDVRRDDAFCLRRLGVRPRLRWTIREQDRETELVVDASRTADV
jgi:hypothetical protein